MKVIMTNIRNAECRFQKIKRNVETKFRSISVVHRLISLQFMVMLVILLWIGAFVTQSIQAYMQILAIESTKILNYTREEIEKDIDTLDTITKFQVIQNAYNSSVIYSQLSQNDGVWNQDYHTSSQVLNELKPLFDLNENISFISIADRNGKSLYCSKNALMYHFYPISPEESFIQKAESENGAMILLQRSDISNPPMNIPQNSLIAARSIMLLSPRKSIGTSLCCIDTSNIIKNFTTYRRFDDESLACFSNSGQQLLGDLPENDIMAFLSSDLNSAGPNQKIFINEGTRYMYFYSQSTSGIWCVIRLPIHHVVSDVIQTKILAFLPLIFIMLLLFLITHLMISSILAPVSYLTAACNNMRDGHLGQIVDEASDEMHNLISAFNEMSERITYLVEEVYQKENVQARIELQLLRSQINPHFMYNTLETIRSEALMNQDYPIIDMVSIFGQLLRYGTSNAASLVTIRDVENYIKNYAKLQSYYTAKNLHINITFSPEIYDTYILRLLLQPLIENCINHGFNNVDPSCDMHIDVIGFQEHDDLIFEVTDNGKGTDAMTVKAVNDYINGRNKDFKSIGLYNVNRRIKIFYGEEYGIQFDAVENIGSSVTVTIPVINDQNFEEYKERDQHLSGIGHND